MSSQTVSRPAQQERGLGYAIKGALAVTLVTLAIGLVLFGWLLSATRGPEAAELLPADVQLYAATTRNVGGVVEVNQLRDALQQTFGISDPGSMLLPLERELGVKLRDDVVTWLGSEVIVTARAVEVSPIQGDPATTLLQNGELLLIFGSKNDPQAEAFLRKHAEARRADGATIAERTVGDSLLFETQGGEPGPLSAFALIQHYVVFSNSAAALEAMANAGAVPDADPNRGLAALPAFAQYRQQISEGRSVTIYTDGSAGAEVARAGVREILGTFAR